MALRCGIVGLPNVGKSTLFNALCAGGAESANYPFCTIDPNIGVVPIADPRLDRLAEISGSTKASPTAIEFVDIAGLVKGASAGEGLGNQFLSHIREVDAIIHVVRCFEDANVVHVSGGIDPASDIEVVETELLLKDIESVEKRIERAEKAAKSGDKQLQKELAFYERVLAHLSAGNPARTVTADEQESAWLASLFLLTIKPVLYAANVSEDDVVTGNDHVETVRKIAAVEGAVVVIVSAEIEAQLSQLDPSERDEFLSDLGLEESGLNRLVHASYKLLNLITFFTTGPKESRAWTLPQGTKAPGAGAVIHTDFERGFIRAETIKFADFDRLASEAKARDAGLMRSEGKEYVVEDGDVILFRFNV